MRREAENEDLLGSAMVYMLAEKMQEWLQENNEPEMADMHSQMMKRQQAEAAAAAEAAQGGEEEEEEEAQSQSSGRLRDRLQDVQNAKHDQSAAASSKGWEFTRVLASHAYRAGSNVRCG